MSLEARGINELTGQMSKVDQAITVINYLIRKKQKRIDQYTRQIEITENQKIFIGEETELISNVQILIKSATKQIGQYMGKLPPQEKDLEKNVLGTAIFENPAFDRVKNVLKPEHFFHESHILIWQAALKVGSPIDFKSVINQLKKTGQLDLVGGAPYVVELTAFSTSNIDVHARCLIEMAIKRKIIGMVGQMLQDAYDDTTDCFELLESAETLIKEINGWIK